MDNAPTLSDLESTTQFQQFETKQPTVSIIGCGGCGTNLIKKFYLSQHQANDKLKVDYSIIDTSMANTQMLPTDIKVYGIGNLGSGKDRSKNVEAIMKYLDNHKNFVTEATDITILVFSMAGGSGSVIAPLLAHRLMRNSNRAVILVGVVDSSSEQDCLNTIKTIKTCSKFAMDNNYYLPLMLFSNIEVGRVAVDRTVVRRLGNLVSMLMDKSITEIDFADKINYLRPTNIGCPAGCYLMTISDDDPSASSDMPGEMAIKMDEGDMVHVCLVVNDTGKTPKILTKVTYVGLSESKKFFSTIGTKIPVEIVNELNETAERYNRNAVETDTTAKSFDGVEENVDKSGIIL